MGQYMVGGGDGRHRSGQPRAGQPRLRRADLRNLPMVLVLVLAAAGLGYSAAVPPHWLRGVMVLAAAMFVAGFLRLVLPARQAGLLAVRGRVIDVVFYTGTGAAIVFAGITLTSAGSV